jgi:hypothetical protein
MTTRRRSIFTISLSGALALAACTADSPSPSATPKTTPGVAAVPFTEAVLRVEINSTDGDAGLQVFLDHEPWRSVSISRPDGTKILDIQTRDVLSEYGLTELFSESSEPPFTEFPLEEFKKLFPVGEYTFRGETIEGVTMESTVTLTHDFPEGPEVVSPEEEATVPPDELVVRWNPVTEPAGIEITGYEVVVTREEPLRVLEADLPATATEMSVPAEFMEAGAEFKVEVLAIEATGHQTLTEVGFSTE